jgi:hypothetical protein
MDPTKEQRVCIRFCANLRKSATEMLTKIIQASLNGMFGLGQTEHGETGKEES